MLQPTSFARLVHERIPHDASIAMLGAAQNDDALWFAQQGHPVTAVLAVDSTLEEAERAGPDAVHTLVMDAYNFDFPNYLKKTNEAFEQKRAALQLQCDTLTIDWKEEHNVQLPLNDQNVDVLYDFVCGIMVQGGFTAAVATECHRVLRQGGIYAAVHYGLQPDDDLNDRVEEQPGLYRHQQYGTVMYRTTIRSIEQACKGLFMLEQLDEYNVQPEDWQRRLSTAPFQAVRCIARRMP